jgi:hypothetical protein
MIVLWTLMPMPVAVASGKSVYLYRTPLTTAATWLTLHRKLADHVEPPRFDAMETSLVLGMSRMTEGRSAYLWAIPANVGKLQTSAEELRLRGSTSEPLRTVR